MPAFEGGKLFEFKYRLVSPNRGVPWINFEVCGMNGKWLPRHGKVDTGATLTILTKDIAEGLHIYPDEDDFEDKREEKYYVKTATGKKIYYYNRWVQIKFEENGQKHVHLVGFAFYDDLERNLFGRDWLNEFCLVFDSQLVSFIKECEGRRPPCPPPQPYNKICVVHPEFD